jgi:threonine dehydrogenase-like Zn-dependent dehydrogenase
MNKIKKISKYNILVISIIIFLLFFIGANTYVSVNYLTAKEKVKRLELENLYGFYEPEEEGGYTYNWTGEEAAKIVKKKGEVVFLPVGNDKPDIEDEGVELKIFVNNEIKFEGLMDSNEWQVIPINVSSIEDDYLKIKFIAGDTWKPADLIEGSEDNRNLGIKAGMIYWE